MQVYEYIYIYIRLEQYSRRKKKLRTTNTHKLTSHPRNLFLITTVADRAKHALSTSEEQDLET